MQNEKASGIKVFQELVLRHADGPPAVRKAVLAHLNPPWNHKTQREDEIREDALGSGDVIALMRDATEKRPGISLWMFEEGDGFKVSNIIPLNAGELGIAGYNQALKDFVDEIVVPAERAGLLNYLLTSPFKTIDDWADSQTVTCLKRFSAAANKSTGRSHPMDEVRWLEFLIAAHTNGAGRDSEFLLRWLVDSEAWPHDIALELASEYDLSRSLLSKYDASR